MLRLLAGGVGIFLHQGKRMKQIVCPKCGSTRVEELYADPVVYACLDCGEVFDEED